MVLIVDSDKTRLTLLMCILKNENIEVRTAETAFEIENILSEDAPCLAMFDSSIKWINMCEFINTCKELKKYESTSFIILPGQQKKAPLNCKLSGVEILKYPIRVYEFLTVINKYIKKTS